MNPTDPTPSISTSPKPSRFVTLAVLAAFFLSGLASLIHEVAWTRLLRLVMGNTTYTITTVLCVFMAGLALGAYIAGRLMKKRNDPLRWFAILEGLIGLYCLFLPQIIEAAEPLYRSLYQTYHDHNLLNLIRFALSALLLLFPACLMGATLPILSRHFVRPATPIGTPIATLYAINSLGAVAGAFAAGFLLIPNLGVNHTITAGAALNFLVFFVGYALYLKDKSNTSPLNHQAAQPLPSTSTPSTALMRILLITYALSGFASLTYEIAWTRVLATMIGSSVYAFSMMLSAFILGLALGSLVISRFVDRLKNPLRALAYIQAAIGLSALLVVPLIGQLPYITTTLIAHFSGSFAKLQLVEFTLILMVMLIPTTLMGASFPLVSRIYAKQQKAVTQAVGTVYASNTLGTIVGAFAAGFILIPVFHIQSTILIAVFTNILVACALLRFGASADQKQSAARQVLALIAIFTIGAIAIPSWNDSRMSVGPFEQGRYLYLGESTEATERIDNIVKHSQLLYHNEGIASTVTVKGFNFPGEKPQITLFVNGKADASSAGSDLPTQILSAQIPMLLHPDPKDVLVIGLASGITLSSAATFDQAQTLDCAEISPGVIQACTNIFSPYNNNVTADPRVNIIPTDGRNHVALTNKTYDVIISEPSNPWIAGVGDLFTHEFFQSAHDRLNDEGLFLVWFDVYNNHTDNFASVLNTFSTVFPNMRLVSSIEGIDYLLVGSKSPFNVPYDRLVGRMNQPKVAADLKRIGIETATDLLNHLVMGPDGIKAFAKQAPLITDDNAMLEFGVPRIMANMKPGDAALTGFDQHRNPDFKFIQPPANTDWPNGLESYNLTLTLAAKNHENKTARIVTDQQMQNALRMIEEKQPKTQIHNLLRKVARGAPLAIQLRDYTTQQVAQVNQLLAEGDTDSAIQIATDLVDIQPNNVRARVLLGLAHHRAQHLTQALEQFNHFLKLNPYSREAFLLVGRTQQGLKNLPAAVEAYNRAIQLAPNSFNALTQLAWIQASAPTQSVRDPQAANTNARRADALARRAYAASLDEFGQALATVNQLDQATQVTTFASQLVANLGEIEPALSIKKHLQDYANNIRPISPPGSFENPDEILLMRQSFASQSQMQYAQTLDLVAAARAASGNYTQAIEAATQAIALIQNTQSESPLIPEIQARLDLYKTNKPYHMPQ